MEQTKLKIRSKKKGLTHRKKHPIFLEEDFKEKEEEAEKIQEEKDKEKELIEKNSEKELMDLNKPVKIQPDDLLDIDEASKGADDEIQQLLEEIQYLEAYLKGSISVAYQATDLSNFKGMVINDSV